MKTKIHSKIKSTSGVLAVPLFEEDLKKVPAYFPKQVKDFIAVQVKLDYKAKKKQRIWTYGMDKKMPEIILLVGLGEKQEFNEKAARKIARDVGGKIGHMAKGVHASEISILMQDEISDYLQEMAEGLLSAQYDIAKLKAKRKKEEIYKLDRLDFIIAKETKAHKKALENAELIGKASELTKDLVNFPSNMVDPEYLAREAKSIARENRYKMVVLHKKDLKKMGWGGLLAVNRGSVKEAMCIVLEHDGAINKREKPIVIVGKGVIFDTGGYDLKPSSSMSEMHQDMAGAAVVLGVFTVLKKLGIRKNIIGIIPTTENLITSDAYRSSDIITMLSGLTCEITNTDAEGRLILADALHYGTTFNPNHMITIATLTGAAAVATGNRYAALMGNDDDIRNKLQKAGDEVDDWGWPLPLTDDYRDKMKSKLADIRNYDVSSGRYAGASKAAGFLERFVEKNKWCHIDIGGTAFSDDPKAYQTHGATAHGLRMLIKYLQD